MSDVCQFTTMLNRSSKRLGVVLMPYLGRARAHERGATIAQMLVDGCEDPVTLCNRMLPELQETTRKRAAAHVARAWLSLAST
jgi:hypothetical protein